MPTFTQQQYTCQVQPPAPTKFFTPVVTALIALLLAGSCLTFWFGMDFIYYFGLTRPEVMKWKIWQLFTYNFIEPCWWNLLIDVSIIVFCGSAIERLYKSRNLAIFFALVMPLFGLIMLLVMMLFKGIPFNVGGDVLYYGMLGMFAYCYRKQRVILFLWTVEADKIAWLFVIFSALLSIPLPYTLIFVAATPLGWFYMKLFKGGGIRIGGLFSPKTGGHPAGKRKEGFVDID